MAKGVYNIRRRISDNDVTQKIREFHNFALSVKQEKTFSEIKKQKEEKIISEKREKERIKEVPSWLKNVYK
ncbi:MAG: hypothetical protein ABF802_10690 [Acetobacter orientalis]|uniref:hypothetical protein n=1 Tax=Acetobacter orientalis TaxID=146474 RepID=UPI0039EBF1DC